MNRNRARARDYLEHMTQATARISAYVKDLTEQQFQTDTLVQDAVIRNLEVLGEAAKNFTLALPDAATRFPEIPFGIIYATRNVLTHEYFQIDLEIVWRVVEKDLPSLKKGLDAARSALTKDQP